MYNIDAKYGSNFCRLVTNTVSVDKFESESHGILCDGQVKPNRQYFDRVNF